MKPHVAESRPAAAAALVIHPDVGGRTERAPAARLSEALGLARAVGLDVRRGLVAPVRAQAPATLLGRGKTAEIAEICASEKIAVVVVDGALSPVQQRNLERAWKAKVVDRTGLILEIFGRRARTREGRLQVELARLAYERSRLVKTWTHLERQRGGFGFLGGPGETQIEADRRLIGERIKRLKSDLSEVRRTRGLGRRARQRVPFPTIALVGYTNAGKSSLFNRLTGAEVGAANLLFATLDPTLRRLDLADGRAAVLSDTVGFISELPHELVEAFRATLEEVEAADLICHVRDISAPESEAERADVEKVLDELNLGEGSGRRILEVWNKVDLLSSEAKPEALGRAARQGALAVSAQTGEGLEALRARLGELIDPGPDLFIELPASDGEALAWLYRHGRIVERAQEDERLVLAVRLEPEAQGRFDQLRPGARRA
ncbi:MAG: GTPase HflX [Caulobacteraceae bacterium]